MRQASRLALPCLGCILAANLIHADPAPRNTLTPAERTDGYEALWNGLDFEGWKHYRNPAMVGSTWTVARDTGAARFNASDDPDSNSIRAGREPLFTIDSAWRDFDLKVEWRGAPENESMSTLGCFFRESAGGHLDMSARQTRFQNKRTAEFQRPIHTTGALYDLVPVLPSRLDSEGMPNWVHHDGEWNSFRIVSYGNRVAHYGNGVRLLEYRMGTPQWDKAVRESRFGNYPGWAQAHAGSIAFEADAGTVNRFRGIRIKRLTEDPWAAGSPYLQKGGVLLIDSLAQSANLFPNPPSSTRKPGASPARSPSFRAFRPDGRRLIQALPAPNAPFYRDSRGFAPPAGP